MDIIIKDKDIIIGFINIYFLIKIGFFLMLALLFINHSPTVATPWTVGDQTEQCLFNIEC